MKRIVLFLLTIATAALSAYCGGATKTYYSSVTATASGAGTVYVDNIATDNPTYGTTNTASQSSEKSNHEYHLYAQTDDGKTFLGWYNGNTKLSEELYFKNSFTVSSTDESNPTKFNITGRFGDKPAVMLHSDWAETTISNLTNKIGQKITINTQQPWTIEGQVNMAYGFDGWYEADGTLFCSDTYCEFTIDREMDLYARWSLRPGQLTKSGYYRIANMFNDYVQVTGNQDISFNTNSTYFAPDIMWYNHPRHFYYGFKQGVNNNAYAEPSIIIYVEGTINEANVSTYGIKKDVMTDVKMSGQGVVANDHMKGAAEGKPIKITWSGSPNGENQYHILASVGSTNLAFKYLWGKDCPAVMKNNSDTFDDMHFEAVDLEHIDTNWFAAFPAEDMEYDGGYWSTLYTAFPFECYAEDGVEAYYVTLESYGDETIAVLHRIEDGIVPPHTPVLLKSPQVIDTSRYFSATYHGWTPEPANRLIPLAPSVELETKAAEIAEVNCLKGTYQLNTETKLVFDSSKKVLGVSADGTVGFYNLEQGTELRGNRAYLALDRQGASQTKIRIMSESEASGVLNIVDKDNTDFNDDIYDIYGRKVINLMPGTIYISKGKKFIAH